MEALQVIMPFLLIGAKKPTEVNPAERRYTRIRPLKEIFKRKSPGKTTIKAYLS